MQLAAVQSSPWLRSGSYSPTQPDRERNNNRRTHPTNNRHRKSKQTKDQRQTKDTAEKRGGENPQKDRTDLAAPVNDKANSTRGQWTLAPEQQDRSQESPTLARGRATHTHIQKQGRAKRQGERRQSSGGRAKHRHRDTQHRGRRRRRGQEAATERGRNGTQEPERVLKRLTERPLGVLEHQR